ncbi:MAG: DUF4115 domain-containing protein [Acidimicrobiaceae bacterium]|nr:DUF4115 domain-containing protein [Acidimicrobiaceae bacterium]
MHTEVLHFDDGAADGSSLESATPIFGGDRKVNTKVLAVASIVALVGLGALVVVLSSSNPVTIPRSPAVALPHSSQSNSTTATTQARPTPPGPLMPTSADSTGAIYFLNASSITLDIHSSAPSWIEESVAPGSKILWQGIIPSGGSKTFTLGSSMWVRTGNVGVLTLTANGQPVSFTAPPGVYEFTFRQGVKA